MAIRAFVEDDDRSFSSSSQGQKFLASVGSRGGLANQFSAGERGQLATDVSAVEAERFADSGGRDLGMSANFVEDTSLCQRKLAVEVMFTEKTKPSRIEAIEFADSGNLLSKNGGIAFHRGILAYSCFRQLNPKMFTRDDFNKLVLLAASTTGTVLGTAQQNHAYRPPWLVRIH